MHAGFGQAASVNIDRHQARILAMQILCQLDVQGDDFLSKIPVYLGGTELSRSTRKYAQGLVERAWERRSASGEAMRRQVPNWSPERLTPVDRNILRVAEAELEMGKVPAKVIINEAVQIAHEFGTAESPAFVNGVLDGIWKAKSG